MEDKNFKLWDELKNIIDEYPDDKIINETFISSSINQIFILNNKDKAEHTKLIFFLIFHYYNIKKNKIKNQFHFPENVEIDVTDNSVLFSFTHLDSDLKLILNAYLEKYAK